MLSPLLPARCVTFVILALLAAVSMVPGRAAAIPSLPFEVAVLPFSLSPDRNRTAVPAGSSVPMPVKILNGPVSPFHCPPPEFFWSPVARRRSSSR
jgi:hypothetical protein